MKQLAILGGKPSFDLPLSIAHHYQPKWNDVQEMIDGIFERKYYTNHGYLAQRFERNLSEFLGVRHAIVMSNMGIGLMISVKALDLKGSIILPAFSHVGIAQAMTWAGLNPIFCDVKKETLHIDDDRLESLIDSSTNAILGVNLFGGTCAYERIDKLTTDKGMISLYVSSEAIGEQYNGMMVGNFGHLEIFSLNEDNIINCGDGCLITTNDDHLAARLRNIRSSYGSGPVVPIAFTGNGRMSEIQAGWGQLTLNDYPLKVTENEASYAYLHNRLKDIPGIHVYQPDESIQNRNYSTLLIHVDKKKYGMGARMLAKVLNAENIECNVFQHYCKNPNSPFDIMSQFGNAFELSKSLVTLPINNTFVSTNYLETLCFVVEEVRRSAHQINLAKL